jgi:high-affinity iron transporter
VTVRRGLAVATAAVALLAIAPAGASAAVDSAEPWKQAADLRSLLAEAEKELIIEGSADALPFLDRARPIAEALAERVRGEAPATAAAVEDGVRRAALAVRAGDPVELAAARAEVRVAVYGAAYRMVVSAIEAGDAATAEEWLLVREFRKPTRFSRPGADATLALQGLASGSLARQPALAAVRADLLDTYQARLRASLETVDGAVDRGFRTRAASEATLAAGYAAILLDAFRDQRGAAAADTLAEAFAQMASAAAVGDRSSFDAARASIDEALAGFRAAPLSDEEAQRRAGQFLRFLALVPIEYERGVKDGRVTLDFEIQEAITFRDGAAQALGDLEYVLIERDATAVARMQEVVDSLGTKLAQAARGDAVADPTEIEAATAEALELADGVFPEQWKETSAADFDVIRASLDRVQGAVEAGEYAKAEQARLEAYAFFEFGPEQRLRGIAPDLFVRSEGLFWYGADDYPGLAQLIKRKASAEELASTREALDQALADAEAAVGAGPGSTISVITNTAIIVFREGLEAVLILAALTAGMVGAQRRYRRPMLFGAAGALVASVVTFVIAQTVLESLTRYGEKLEAIVSLVAIAVLLLILNWFFHKVYWSEHLAELHGKKRTLLRGAGLSIAAAQLLGLAMLGFTAVYREGFETVLFLQAIVLEAGVGTVVEGVLLGLVGVAGIGVLTLFLQRKLPHKRMLELTGVLILAVLVIMVGKTVQVCQVVGWLPVHPIQGVRLPYWAGAWFGVFPTWEGVIAQVAAVALVLGSYFGAERLRARKRARILREPAPAFAAPRIEHRHELESREQVTTL